MKKVMIVDDSEPDQFLTKTAIHKHNPDIEIIQAYDGKEALELLAIEDVQPDIIFLDINMPVMDGHEFLEEYNKQDGDKNIVIIMLSSSDQEQDKEKAQAYCFVKKYFTKPLSEIDVALLAKLKI